MLMLSIGCLWIPKEEDAGRDSRADAFGDADTDSDADTDADADADTRDEDGPEIFIDAPVSSGFGESFDIGATIRDYGSAVASARLHYRNETDDDYTDATMDLHGGNTVDGYWEASVPGAEHRSAAILFYVEAVDASSNVATWPEAGADDPSSVRLEEG